MASYTVVQRYNDLLQSLGTLKVRESLRKEYNRLAKSNELPNRKMYGFLGNWSKLDNPNKNPKNQPRSSGDFKNYKPLRSNYTLTKFVLKSYRKPKDSLDLKVINFMKKNVPAYPKLNVTPNKLGYNSFLMGYKRFPMAKVKRNPVKVKIPPNYKSQLQKMHLKKSKKKPKSLKKKRSKGNKKLLNKLSYTAEEFVYNKITDQTAEEPSKEDSSSKITEPVSVQSILSIQHPGFMPKPQIESDEDHHEERVEFNSDWNSIRYTVIPLKSHACLLEQVLRNAKVPRSTITYSGDLNSELAIMQKA